jgi:YidC/Oxa1 family membrane protein insertase
MPATEIQRIVLIIGLAATAYLMMLAWNEDYGRPGEAPRTEAPALATLPADPPVGDVGQKVGSGDVPDDSLLGPVGAQQPSQVAPDALDTRDALSSEERWVRVTTNDLDLWIDRRGGDIVRVQLPGFPVSKDQPEVPFILLDSGNGHTYVAQSGLIGPDGTDTGGQRPLFSAAAASETVRLYGGQGVCRAARVKPAVRAKQRAYCIAIAPDEYRHRASNGPGDDRRWISSLVFHRPYSATDPR